MENIALLKCAGNCPLGNAQRMRLLGADSETRNQPRNVSQTLSRDTRMTRPAKSPSLACRALRLMPPMNGDK